MSSLLLCARLMADYHNMAVMVDRAQLQRGWSEPLTRALSQVMGYLGYRTRIRRMSVRIKAQPGNFDEPGVALAPRIVALAAKSSLTTELL